MVSESTGASVTGARPGLMPNTHTDGSVKLSLGPQAMLSSEGLALLPENTRGTLESAPSVFGQ